MKRNFLSIVCIILITMSLVGCSESPDDNTYTDSDMYIDQVKNATKTYTANEVSYGEAFDEFFKNPHWKYFSGTYESSDEDGDGLPDEEIENLDIVEFTGECVYQEVEVKALIQFVLDEENGTFSAEFLSLNEVPQNKLTLASLVDAVFSQYVDNHPEKFEPQTQDLSDENPVQNPESVDYMCGVYYDIEGYNIRAEVVKIDKSHARVILSQGNVTDYDYVGELLRGADGIYYISGEGAMLNLTKDWLLNISNCEMKSYNTFYELEK